MKWPFLKRAASSDHAVDEACERIEGPGRDIVGQMFEVAMGAANDSLQRTSSPVVGIADALFASLQLREPEPLDTALLEEFVWRFGYPFVARIRELTELHKKYALVAE